MHIHILWVLQFNVPQKMFLFFVLSAIQLLTAEIAQS